LQRTFPIWPFTKHSPVFEDNLFAAVKYQQAYFLAQRCKLKIVVETPKKPLDWLKALFWAALWSTALTTFIVVVIEANNRCFLIVNGATWVWMMATLTWLWLLLFLFFDSNRSRLTLMGSTVLVFLALPYVDRSPVGAAEATVVMHLRGLAVAIESYRKEHPLEGYLANLPKISSSSYAGEPEKFYKIDFTTSQSKPGGPADGFLIQATPVWRDCGYVRSFAAGDDGHIHFTLEMRPATKTDAVIE